jgi:P-type Cu2+ transporter
MATSFTRHYTVAPQGRVKQQIAAGDIQLVLVRPGASIPAGSTVEDGDSQVNQAMITGGSRSVHKHPGDQVIAGIVNSAAPAMLR